MKCKVKFPCNLCKDDHLTYLCPRIDESLRFLAQGPVVLTNPLLHNQNMNLKSHDQSSENDPPETSARGCINMVHAAKVVTRAKDYGPSLWIFKETSISLLLFLSQDQLFTRLLFHSFDFV